jgi:wobble nucleotide-excising tRNase
MSEELNEANEIVESQPKKKKISIFRSSLFNKTYVTNVIVTSTDVDFRLELFNEKFKIEDGWAYHSDGLLILTRAAAKKLLVTLEEKIKSFEKENGEIKVDEERMEVQYSI